MLVASRDWSGHATRVRWSFPMTPAFQIRFPLGTCPTKPLLPRNSLFLATRHVFTSGSFNVITLCPQYCLRPCGTWAENLPCQMRHLSVCSVRFDLI